jgi:membrane-bound serine protease (ClpP class)
MSMLRRTILHPFLFIVLSLFPLIGMTAPYRVQEISHLEINSAISPATYDYLKYQFEKVPEGALILIKMNTPGGLITTTKDIITLIGTQDKPVVIWITPEGASASSAGAIIAASAHFILMSSGTNLGAATPVGLGEDIGQKDNRNKAMNDLKAMVRALSQSRNRPAKPFEDMIETAKSFTDQEALNLKIIDGVLSNGKTIREILDQKSFSLQGKAMELQFIPEAISKVYDATLGQKILNVIANPSTAYLLFLLGVALLYFELQAPGGFIAGGIGACLLVLAAISFQVLPVDWGALTLILIGIILLILEVYITSYGLLAIAGIASFVAGSLFLFHGESGFIAIDYPVLISTLLGVGFALGTIIWYLIKDRKKQNKHENFFLPIGSKGIVLTLLEGEGSFYQIKVRGEIWRGQSLTKLSLGDRIEVTSIDSDKLIAEIKKVDKE